MASKPKNGHKQVKEMIQWLSEEFMPACIRKGGPFKQGTLHVVFAFGTIVRVNPQEHATVQRGWTFNVDVKDYPTHRFQIKSEARQAIDDIGRDYKDVLSRCKPEHANAIRVAYKALHGSGYPHPGGFGGDSVTLPLASKGDGTSDAEQTGEEDSEAIGLWGTIFPETGGMDIISLVLEPENKALPSVDALGREQRRLDFMMTRVVAVVDGDCKVTHLE